MCYVCSARVMCNVVGVVRIVFCACRVVFCACCACCACCVCCLCCASCVLFVLCMLCMLCVLCCVVRVVCVVCVVCFVCVVCVVCVVRVVRVVVCSVCRCCLHVTILIPYVNIYVLRYLYDGSNDILVSILRSKKERGSSFRVFDSRMCTRIQ